MTTPHTPSIDAACGACNDARIRTGRTDALCDEHANTPPSRAPHTYHYERRLPLRQHDSNVIPTGVGDPKHQR